MRIQYRPDTIDDSNLIVKIDMSTHYMTSRIEYYPIIKDEKNWIVGVSRESIDRSIGRSVKSIWTTNETEMMYLMSLSSDIISWHNLVVNRDKRNPEELVPWDVVKGTFFILDESKHIMARGPVTNNDQLIIYVTIPLVTSNEFISIDEWIIPILVFDIRSSDYDYEYTSTIYKSLQAMARYTCLETFTNDLINTKSRSIVRIYIDGNGNQVAEVRVSPGRIAIKGITGRCQYYYSQPLVVDDAGIKDVITLRDEHGENPIVAVRANTVWKNIVRKDWDTCEYK